MAKIVDHYRKVVTAPGLKAVGKHNAREDAYDQAGNPVPGKWAKILSHPERRELNEYSTTTGVELLTARRARIKAAALDRKPQKNAAAAVEVVISAGPEWFAERSRAGQRRYFIEAREWIEAEFGKDQVLGWAIHYDETTPHMHVLLVPLTQTKEVRKREEGQDVSRTVQKTKEWSYSSSRFLGGPQGMVRLHDEFAERVGKVYGLERGERGSLARNTNPVEWAAKLKKREQAVVAREEAVADREEALGAKIEEVNAWLESVRPRISAELANEVEETKPRPLRPRTRDGGLNR